MTHKLRCFVAMAFGYKDTDALYANYIKPAIIKIGFTPVRIDKLLHNDRIDARIREEILKADVLIADLTYARPSVYWEAGYAERTTPVIYSCRKDHFKPSSDDKHGNFSVHFDLINANILSWSENDGHVFAKELGKRLLFVTEQLRSDKEKQMLLVENRKKFLLISVSDKRQQISSITKPLLEKGKFTLVKISIDEKHPFYRDELLRAESSEGLFWKKSNKTGILLSANYCYLSLIQREFQLIKSRKILNSMSDYKPVTMSIFPKSIRRKLRGVKRIRAIKLIPVLSSISASRIQTCFDNWNKLNSEDWYYFQNQKGEGIPIIREVIFVSNIKSKEEYAEKVLHLLKTIDTDESN